MISLHIPLSVSPPLISSHILSSNDIKRAVKVMGNHTAIDEEEFQANFLKHGIHSLNSHTVDLFNNVVCSSSPKLDHSNLNNYKTIIRAHILQALQYSSSFMAFKQTWKEVTKGQRTCKFLLGVPHYKPYFHTHNHYWGGSQIVDIKTRCVSQSIRKQCYNPYYAILKEVCSHICPTDAMI